METKTLCKKKRDFNQNLIESTGSFEQLYDMITQLEKGSNIEITEWRQFDTCIKYDADLDSGSRNSPVQVSDRSFIYRYLICKTPNTDRKII